MADVNLTTTAVTPTTTTLATLLVLLRRELHDEDAANYRWTDDELERHLLRAVRELSLVLPREQKTTLTTTAGSRDVSIAALADVVRIEAVEYPVGEWPPVYVQHSVWQTALTLLVDGAPSGVEDLYVYWGKVHQLDGSVSSLPTVAEDAVVTGAAAYAALEWSSYATNRANIGGSATWRNYQAWGEARLGEFRSALERFGSAGRVRATGMYGSARPVASQTVQWES